MEIRFFGAARGVTGSCHMLCVNGRQVLLDCGLFQGRRNESYQRNANFHFDASKVDAVIQSHAHIDHSGKLPMLVREGFHGTIHATHGTRDLCTILLHDCAHILSKDAEFLNKKRMRNKVRGSRKGNAPPTNAEVMPLYLDEDVDETLSRFLSHRYGEWFAVLDGVRARFHEAGHILGSAWVEVEATEDGEMRRIVFTGDYGRSGLPLLRDPEPFVQADIIISESTYGGKTHPGFADMQQELADAVKRLVARGRGRLLIPAFAVGRTQNILYELGRVFESGAAPKVPVIVDSPLATAATSIVKNYCRYYDDEALEQLECIDGRAQSLCPGVRFTESVGESKLLNSHPGPMIVLSASGMMETGRILHHLANWIGSPNTELLVVGFQAEHTLGRRLAEGAKEVSLLGEHYQVGARLTTMDGVSAHADPQDFLRALKPLAKHAKILFLVHGEDGQRRPLSKNLKQAGFERIEEPVEQQAFRI